MIKKLSLLFGLLFVFCFFAGCNNTTPGGDNGDDAFDPTELPYYMEDTSNLTYSYSEEERLRPYWMGNVIYNEQLMVVEKDGVVEGHLLYNPIRIVSVRDWTLQTEYVEGVDYVVNGNTITLPEGSSIPVFKDEWSRGINVPEEYPEGNAGTGYQMFADGVIYTETGLIWKNYIHVTYVYDPADVDRTKVKTYGDELYGLSQKIANKEVEWDFSDSEEAAIYDMRLGMEKTFMFGVKRMIYDSKKKEIVSLTGGIWWQAGKEYEFDPKSELTQNDLIDIMKEAFTGNGGNKRKVLIGGSDFIGRINKLEITKVVSANDDFVKWGIDFSEIKSKFGKLFILYSEVFDDCGMSDYGFIFDPEFISKWAHVPFGSQKLDLKGAGIRNTDALVLTEASCLTLRYPAAHMRIVPKTA